LVRFSAICDRPSLGGLLNIKTTAEDETAKLSWSYGAGVVDRFGLRLRGWAVKVCSHPMRANHYLKSHLESRLPDEQLQKWLQLAKQAQSYKPAAVVVEFQQTVPTLVEEVLAERKAHDRTMERLEFYIERERDFAKMLKVANGGEMPSDWGCAIRNLAAERDELREKLAEQKKDARR
jgi:hypothetical protein